MSISSVLRCRLVEAQRMSDDIITGCVLFNDHIRYANDIDLLMLLCLLVNVTEVPLTSDSVFVSA